MKKIILALILVLVMSVPAFAVFSSKGAIPNGEPIEYRGLQIASDGVNIIIVNRGENKITFSATCVFIGKNNVATGDFFIDEIVLEPLEHKQLKKLYLKGDSNLCKKAESLRWTIYTLEKSK